MAINKSSSNSNIHTPAINGSYSCKLIDVIPANQYLKTIGFFCIKELEIEKALKMPVRFRLGSVAYTDKMESKNTFRPVAK
jgi:hypothetical protein